LPLHRQERTPHCSWGMCMIYGKNASRKTVVFYFP
jgi:hypothetical protein